MSEKQFKLSPSDIKNLVPKSGYCLATDKITVEGMPIGFMYREEPEDEDDSGWRFLSGTEDESYMDDEENSGIYDLNTIANYDQAIIYYLKMPYGTEMERIEGSDRFKKL